MTGVDPMHANAVEVRKLNKSFGSVSVIKDVSFHVRRGETVTLLGPSGCGKTTTLRCIAGLEQPSSGSILVDGQIVFDHAHQLELEPEKRNIGMVFQSYAIWPHMTVGENVRFPLTIRKMSPKARDEKVADILKSVGLGDYLNRPASQLSGGQQQRVALARALVFEPSVILFDEPLSNLDANLRDHMRNELQELQARIGFTAIYVTHDQREALSLSDEVIVMNDGRIDQMGRPEDVFALPRTAFTAKFLGCQNIFKGKLSSQQQNEITVQVAPDMSLIGSPFPGEKLETGIDVALVIRANKIKLSHEPASHDDQHLFEARVESRVFFGTHLEYALRVGALQMRAEAGIAEQFEPGETVHLAVHRSDCHVVRV